MGRDCSRHSGGFHLQERMLNHIAAETEGLPGSARRADSLPGRRAGNCRRAIRSTPTRSRRLRTARRTHHRRAGVPGRSAGRGAKNHLGLIGGEIAEAVAAGRRAGEPALVAGGNCAAPPGVLGGLQQAHGPAARIGLVWFDAHGDFNTPRTTLSGMLGGMPVAVAAGLATRAGASCRIRPRRCRPTGS